MRRCLALALLTCFLLAGCAEPPSKEMNQAQGAIDAAKAAGAEQYAATELTAAVEALRQSEEAVTQRDYRLALSHAIDSRERAQAAAKAAVEARARARGDVERLIAEAAALLAQAQERMRAAEQPAQRRRVDQQRPTIELAEKSLQDARTALNRDDYPSARKAVEGVAGLIRKAIEAMPDAAAGVAAPRRR